MYSDLVWFDAGLVVSSLSVNPLLSYVFVVVTYATCAKTNTTSSLIGAFGGVSMGLFLRDMNQWNPIVYKSGLKRYVLAFFLCTGWIALFPLQWFPMNIVPNAIPEFVLYVLISSIPLALLDRYFPRLIITLLLHIVWMQWERGSVETFTEFYRLYVLCCVPFVFLVGKSLMSWKRRNNKAKEE